MKIKIYQVNMERDKKGLCFMGFSFTAKHGGIDSKIYDLVYEGDVPARDLEDVYRIFNEERPKGYKGRSLSVSDIVFLEEKGTFHFCDSIGFVKVKFDAS